MNLNEAELEDVLDKLSGKLSHHMNRIELLRQERERKGHKIPSRDELELVNKVRNLQQHFHKLTNNKFNEGIEMNEYLEDLVENDDPKYQQKKEKKLASLSKQIDDHVGRLGLATERRRMKSGGSQHYQSNLEVRLHSKIDKLRQDHHRLKVGDIWPEKKSIWENVELEELDIEDLTEEELMELDKKTLASYIKKASSHAMTYGQFGGIEAAKNKFHDSQDLYLKGFKRLRGISRATDRLVKEDLEDLIDNIESENYVEASNIFHQLLSQKIDNRIEEMKHGVNESLEDLTEEELMELDKKTLASYIKKAAHSLGDNSITYGRKKAEADEVDRFTNRTDFETREKLKDKLGVSTKEQGKYWEKAVRRAAGIEKASDRLVKESD